MATLKCFLMILGFAFSINLCNAATKYVIIRSLNKPDLVLGVVKENSLVVLQEYTSDLQLWELRQSSNGDGVFNIINKGTGKALEFNIENYDGSVYLAETGTINDSVNQQWFINSDSSIASVGHKKNVLDIRRSVYAIGTEIIIHTPTENPNQQFTLDPQ